MAIKKSQIEKWIVAQKKHRLSDTHVQMARELGLNPDKLGKIDNHRQESWKAPLPEFIEEIFYKRFKKERPDIVKPLKQILKEQEIKDKEKKKEKEKRRNLYNVNVMFQERAENDKISFAQSCTGHLRLYLVEV